MANPTVTYTFVNGNVADASQVNQNFTDIINGLTDGTKSLNIDAITAAGAAIFNGAVTLGNATGDTITVNGLFAGTGGDASGTQRGLINTAAQSFGGVKTFADGDVKSVKNTSGTVAQVTISGNDGSGDGGASVVLQDNGTTKWSIFTRRVSSANKLYFNTTLNATTGEQGSVSEAGGWTLGPSGYTGLHTINGGFNQTIGDDDSGLVTTFSSGSYTGECILLSVNRASSTAYKFIRCDNTSGSNIFYVRGDSTIFASNTTVQSSSDIRLKNNINSIDSSIDKICALNPVTWSWIDNREGEKKGFIAQEVEKIYPEFVDKDDKGFKTVGMNGNGMVAELVKAIQELKKEIDILKAR